MLTQVLRGFSAKPGRSEFLTVLVISPEVSDVDGAMVLLQDLTVEDLQSGRDNC